MKEAESLTEGAYMELRFWHFLKGYVRIRIVGNSYDRFLNLCAYHGIALWDLVSSGEAYEAYVTLSDFRKLRQIVRKSRTFVRITQRYGLPFFIHKYRNRRLYVIGIAAAALFMLWLSSHVWNISIEGNVSQTDDVIFEYLEKSGISHGMTKSKVDCTALSSQLRNYFPRFSWVTAQLKGTCLVINVKEGTASGDMQETEEKEPSGIAAAKKGTVLSVYTRKGRSVVCSGDEVQKGDLLISGILPIYDDSKALRSVQYVCADGDVLLQTQTHYRDELALTTRQKRYTGRSRNHYSVNIGGMPFALPVHGEAYEQSDVLAQTRQAKFFENFYLPLQLTKYTVKEYEMIEIKYTKEQAQEILQSNFEYFIKKLKEKGVQIFENDVKIEWNEKSAIASGVLITGENAVSRVAIDRAEEELLKNEYG